MKVGVNNKEERESVPSPLFLFDHPPETLSIGRAAGFKNKISSEVMFDAGLGLEQEKSAFLVVNINTSSSTMSYHHTMARARRRQ